LLAVGAGLSWRGLEHYAYAGPERVWAHALRTGDDQGTTTAARRIAGAIPAGARVLADEDGTAAPILLSRRPAAFVTHAGAGDDAWRAALAQPAGRVQYLLAARGDAVDRAHPGLADNGVAGLEVIAAAGPYVLVRV